MVKIDMIEEEASTKYTLTARQNEDSINELDDLYRSLVTNFSTKVLRSGFTNSFTAFVQVQH